MANFLLTEEEYNAVKALRADALAQAAKASPRLSSHYQKIAKLHAAFLSKEDGKRAARTVAQETNNEITQLRTQRRAEALQAAQQKLAEQQKGNQSDPTAGNTKRTNKAS